jgi:Ca-activated chloride channel family protein
MKLSQPICILAVANGLVLFVRAADKPRFQVSVNMVQLRVTVTDHHGRYIENLGRKDFRVLENGEERTIRSVIPPEEGEKAATTVFVLFDTSDRMYDDFCYAEDAVADFIRGLDPSDAVAVYGFSRNLMRLTPPTRDRAAAIGALRQAVAGDDTSLYDAVLLTLRDAAKIQGNKVLVIFSKGQDRTSMLTPAQVRAVAENDGVPVYVVSARDRTVLTHNAFTELANQTGGQVYFAPSWQKQRMAFASIDDDLNHSYVITYYIPPAKDDSFRRIEVQVPGDKGRRLRVRTRGGYSPSSADLRMLNWNSSEFSSGSTHTQRAEE